MDFVLYFSARRGDNRKQFVVLAFILVISEERAY